MSKQIKFTETALRDGQQSQIATRMPIEDMLPILETMDQAGYYSMEVWGGATFDSCLRYLNEDPWERLRTFRAHVKNTKLQMLLRGQNLLGYRNYADDIVESMVKKSVENGIDVIRIFDALNDVRNLQTSIRAAKEAGGEVQAAICYTTSDVHTVPYFVNLAKEMAKAGADTICIKDMAGVLEPGVATELVGEIKAAVDLPLEVHTHCTAGIAEMTLLNSVAAGADIIDTAISAFAGGTSQPCTESMAIALEGMGYSTGLNMDKLEAIAQHFAPVRTKFKENGTLNPKVMEVEPKALLYKVPGGMLSNLISNLKDLKAGRPCMMPQYDFVHHRRKDEFIRVEPKKLIIIDGLMIFYDERIRDILDLKLYVDTPADIRFIRRLQRDIAERGRTLESVIEQYTQVVRPGHFSFIEPMKEYADLIIPEGGYNEQAMQVLFSFVHSICD